jgi:hypothetical protein
MSATPKQNHTFKNKKIDFGAIGLLQDHVRLDKSFPMGPCSTSGDENSSKSDAGVGVKQGHQCGLFGRI